MAFYSNLFSPETYNAFTDSDRTISGFRKSQQKTAGRLKRGDRLVCYMTKLSRWIGILEIQSDLFVDDSPVFYPNDDPFVVRFRVKPIVWLDKNLCIPVHHDPVWNELSFTKDLAKGESGWTGKVRRSLTRIDDQDGIVLEKYLFDQMQCPIEFSIDDAEFRRHFSSRIRRADKEISVSVPEPDSDEASSDSESIRPSVHIQAALADCGEKMGFNIWLPRNDRTRVLQEWKPSGEVLMDTLPLNYDDVTLKTIENIDVIWLKGRSIIRAFEVEHTTAVYSGILRMADLLALQPNMDIKLHIVAPDNRRQKVFDEIQRPVFSLLERAPLCDSCSYISYDSIEELLEIKHLMHLSDSVLDEYAENVE